MQLNDASGFQIYRNMTFQRSELLDSRFFSLTVHLPREECFIFQVMFCGLKFSAVQVLYVEEQQT